MTLGFTGPFVLHPKQLQVNDAWIVFQLNGAPVHTEKDGAFNCVALMDAASCFLFDMIMVPAGKPEPTKVEVRRLLKKGWATKRQYPSMLFVPTGRFPSIFSAEAERLGISVVPVPVRQLFVFIGEAQQGFEEHLQGGGSDSEA